MDIKEANMKNLHTVWFQKDVVAIQKWIYIEINILYLYISNKFIAAEPLFRWVTQQ